MDFQKHNNQQKNDSTEREEISGKNFLNKEMKSEYNSFHLKDHLNASFDKDNIVVSEELIQKTLQAIQSGKEPFILGEENPEVNASIEYKKKSKFPVFKLASIAAVLLILLIGLNILRYLPGASKSIDNASDSSLLRKKKDVVLEESEKANEETESYSIMEEAKTEHKMIKEDKNALSDESADKSNFESAPQESNMGIASISNMMFSDILPFTVKEVSSLSIINSKKESIEFKEEEKINAFFLMLDEYSLLPVEEDTLESQVEDKWDYQIVFTTQDNLNCTIMVGNEIQLKTDDDNRDIIRYTIIGDVEQLKSRLSEYK